jgi:DNA-binding LacI/PurR family transcriptional regulator
MNPLPKPLSLVQQVAEALRDGLQRKLWVERLPGERALCRQLNVSRPTLRAALDLLKKEGWLESSPGRLRAITRRPRRRIGGRPHVVRLLLPFPLQEAPTFLFYWVDRLRETLAAMECALEIHAGRRWYRRRPEKELAQLTRQMPAAAWVLARTTEPMQRWFARQGLPCAVAGSCWPGVNLPSVDVDHRAVARHAAGQLLVRHHRRIVLLVQAPELAGDLEMENGFLEAVDAGRFPNAAPVVARHDGTRPGIRAQLNRLLRMKPAPTAMFVARSMPALAAASELTRRGYRLPQDVAMISRDSDHFLDYFSPELARYVFDPELFARRLGMLVGKLAVEGTVARRHIQLMPEFLKGETLD